MIHSARHTPNIKRQVVNNLPNQAVREEKDILLEARKKLGLTQQQVADKACVAMRHYQMFEGGKRKLSSSSFWTASKVLHALELDVTTFARGGYGLTENNRE
jgi:transcriptional regulator with XRE-family HTH domain